ncbi:MAG: C-terminal binding protein [Chloroflexota bacterium]|nr:C-terminal binding protein [Chloroflexota bacterium]
MTDSPRRVFVTDWDYPTLDLEREVLDRAGLELVPVQCRTEDDVIRLCADADGLLNQFAPLTRRVFARLSRCRVVARYGVGVDNVDVHAATEFGIAVCNVPDYAVEEVSDHAIALLMALVRRTHLLDRAVRAGRWDFSVARPVRRMHGRVLGIVGLGRIGRATARKAAGLGLRVVAHDAQAGEPGFDRGVAEMVSLETLLRESDYISVHVPLTPETRHLVNEESLRMVKREAILVNTGRGGVVDTDALVAALQDGRLAAAGLDVLEQEPIPAGHPLLALESCIITPHAAWYSEEAFVELKTKAAQEVAAVLTGGEPRYCLNPDALRPRATGAA